MNYRKYTQFLLLCLLIYSCGADSDTYNEKNETLPLVEAITSLPFIQLDLKDLSQFETDGDNWTIVEEVYIDHLDEKSYVRAEGSGVLSNQMTETKNAPLKSKFDHGDIELSFQYKMPKNSNSGIYFQGRYELQLADSYQKPDLSISTSGAIYERWDESKATGQKGFDGKPPLLNTSKAPGLWQEMKVYFRAPRFDSEGKKTKNAKFESVYHNGILIQDNVEIAGPSRGPFFEDEMPTGPLFIQGDHGNVAFRKIAYKKYTQDSLTLTDLNYQYFEHPHDNAFPVFDTVSILKEGAAEFFDVDIADKESNHYGLIFKGKLQVPVSGEYLFRTGLDDGGDLLIDSNLVVHNYGSPGFDNAFNSTFLEEGTHELQLNFYDNVWRATIQLEYEGPEIYLHSLGGKPVSNPRPSKNEKIIISEVDKAELIRSFVMYNGEKKTHVISVASPFGAHYSYDLKEGALLKFWKGGFADLTNMWKNRGEPQTLVPLNASLEGQAGAPFIDVKNARNLSYSLDNEGLPTFAFESDNVKWTDFIRPSADGEMLKRTLTVTEGSGEISLLIVENENIKLLDNGLYNVDGRYYIKSDEAQLKGNTLTKTINGKGTITYELFW